MSTKSTKAIAIGGASKPAGPRPTSGNKRADASDAKFTSKSAPVLRLAPPAPPPLRSQVARFDPPPLDLPPPTPPVSGDLLATSNSSNSGNAGGGFETARREQAKAIARSMLLSSSMPADFGDYLPQLSNFAELALDDDESKDDTGNSSPSDASPSPTSPSSGHGNVASIKPLSTAVLTGGLAGFAAFVPASGASSAAPSAVAPSGSVHATAGIVPAAASAGGSGLSQQLRRGNPASSFGLVPPPILSVGAAGAAAAAGSVKGNSNSSYLAARRDSAAFDNERFSIDSLSKSPTVFSFLKQESPQAPKRTVTKAQSSRASASGGSSLRVPARGASSRASVTEDSDLQFAMSFGNDSPLDDAED